jgi:hypothetical protein
MLALKAIATANTEAQTEAAPLIPQSQGVKAGDFARPSPIPMGNGIPIKKPMGKRVAVANRIRMGVVDASKARITWGVIVPNAAKTQRSVRSRLIPEVVDRVK